MALPDWIVTFIEPLDRLGIVHMVTGSVGAMAYGEPRMTTDVDIVLRLESDQVSPLLASFPQDAFYCPPEDVVRHEIGRPTRGHFNVVQHATGMKADFYPIGRDQLQSDALERRQTLAIGGIHLSLAPPEYVILRKLEYHREGGSDKHLRDIASMLAAGCTLDLGWLEPELAARGLTTVWESLHGAGERE